MTQRPNIVTTFKDLESDERVREAIEKRCAHLTEEFHEVSRLEITLAEDGAGFTAHGHVTAKGSDLGAQAEASDLLPAAEKLLNKIARQLRKNHDKRIFGQRREAQRRPPKKNQTT